MVRRYVEYGPGKRVEIGKHGDWCPNTNKATGHGCCRRANHTGECVSVSINNKILAVWYAHLDNI